MGTGYKFECSKCNYKIGVNLGVGFSFKKENEAIVNYVKRGRCGKEWQEVNINNPGAAVNADREIYQCPKCRELEDNNYSKDKRGVWYN